jgi:hypothetical protein
LRIACQRIDGSESSNQSRLFISVSQIFAQAHKVRYGATVQRCS